MIDGHSIRVKKRLYNFYEKDPQRPPGLLWARYAGDGETLENVERADKKSIL